MSHSDRRTFLVQTAGSLAGVVLVPDLALAGPRRLPEPKLVGLVGVGRHGRAIIAELLKIDGARVAALCDSNPARLRTGLEGAPGAEGFADHRAMLEKRRDLDAVIVSTPTHLHRAIVEDVLAAGKHCYCEAPLAHTVDEARAIAAAAAAATGRVFMAGFQGRSNPVYQLARTFYRTDAFRDFVSGRAQYHRKTSWRFPAADPQAEKTGNWRLDPEVSTGLVGELGAQQFDVFHWFRGSLPASVRGSGSVQLHRDGRTVPDTVQATLRWADGTLVAYEATLANTHGGQYEVLHGSNAAMTLAWSHGWMFKEVDSPTLGWEVYALRQQFHQDEGIILIADATKLASQGQLKAGVGLPYPPLYYALADFLRSVSYPNVPVPCTAQDGLRATVVGVLANQAVITKTEIAIPPERPA
jgi:predicted dehydrogenase